MGPDTANWKLSEAWAHWVDETAILWRVGECDEHGVPYRFFLHASPTATLRATPDGVVSDELPQPAPLKVSPPGASRPGAARATPRSPSVTPRRHSPRAGGRCPVLPGRR